MGTLATLTKSGRAAIASAIAARPLHLAWGSGLQEWDEEGFALPSLVEATALTNEVGRRAVTRVGFVDPDNEGDIVVPVGINPDGSVQSARYRQTEEVTPFLYVRVNYEFADASSAVIRELGVFMDTAVDPSLPPGQTYFTPAEIANPGRLLAAQIILPAINRSPSVRQTIEFVLPI